MPEKASNRKVREAIHAGSFYPDDPSILSARIAELLAAAQEPVHGPVRAIISPHAGMDYSGDLAALAWKAASGRSLRRIVLLGPLHRAAEPGIYLPESDIFECPTGKMAVDAAAVEALRDCGTFYVENDIPHLEEHSIEVQLPFACAIYPEAVIVPILMGKTTLSSVKSLATGLRIVFGDELEETLFVVSSDLEFASDAEASREASDRFLRLIAEGDWESIVAIERKGATGACGAGCIAALLASGLAGHALLLGRHGAGSAREADDEARGEYAAVALFPA